jgi:hypothetical protein
MGCPDHLAQLLGFVGYKLAKVSRRAASTECSSARCQMQKLSAEKFHGRLSGGMVPMENQPG